MYVTKFVNLKLILRSVESLKVEAQICAKNRSLHKVSDYFEWICNDEIEALNVFSGQKKTPELGVGMGKSTK